MTILIERWKAVPGFEGLYQVSNTGRVKSLRRLVWNGQSQYWLGERVLAPTSGKKGYLSVFLRRDGKSFRYYVHHLVLTAFIGPRPVGCQCRHFPDRNPANNCLDNLSWGTQLDNEADKVVHGTTRLGCQSSYRGEKHHLAIMSENSVREARSLHANGCRVSALAKRFRVDWATMRDLLQRKSWKHVV